MVNKIKISGKHAFQRDLLKTEDNHESRKGEKLGFRYFFRFVTLL